MFEPADTQNKKQPRTHTYVPVPTQQRYGEWLDGWLAGWVVGVSALKHCRITKRNSNMLLRSAGRLILCVVGGHVAAGGVAFRPSFFLTDGGGSLLRLPSWKSIVNRPRPSPKNTRHFGVFISKITAWWIENTVSLRKTRLAISFFHRCHVCILQKIHWRASLPPFRTCGVYNRGNRDIPRPRYSKI